MKLRCAVCKRPFEGRRSTARYCGPTCRQRAKRRRPAAAEKKPARSRRAATKPDDADDAPPAPSGLVARVTADLQAAERLDTVNGQLALQLAAQICAPGATGVASLSKELTRILELALAGAVVKSDAEDEVEKARKAREAKLRNATG